MLGHELSAYYDMTHGATLSIIIPHWMEYVYQNNIARFVKYAVDVWGIDVYKRQGLNLPMLINVLENRTEISLNSLPEVAMEGGKNGIVNMKELIS